MNRVGQDYIDYPYYVHYLALIDYIIFADRLCRVRLYRLSRLRRLIFCCSFKLNMVLREISKKFRQKPKKTK